MEVESLTKRYGSTTGVEEVSFAVEQGEVFGYLGPNGSGKTTTIRCLMGLLRPSSGSCRLLGEKVRSGRATGHCSVGYLPGDFYLWPQLSSRKALKMFAALGDDNDTAKRREQLAERLGLDLDRQVSDLSKGNRQKAGVIFAFQHQPQVLILDEPTIGLDPLVRQTVLTLIREVAEAGATVLLSSHDLTEVAAVCGRAAILRKGRLVKLAAISEIVHKGQRRLKVWFVEGAQVAGIIGEKPEGVRILRQEAGMIEIAYQGTVEVVLKWLCQFGVDRIATQETSLEEAFIQYYSDGASNEGGAL